jgi:hypothetical protein
MEKYMEQARALAAQCWCDKETSNKGMDVTLAEAFAKRIAIWMDYAVQMAQNVALYRELLNECSVKIKQLQKENEDLQTQIDNLMLEFTPNEMSEEQKQRWSKYQQPIQTDK